MLIPLSNAKNLNNPIDVLEYVMARFGAELYIEGQDANHRFGVILSAAQPLRDTALVQPRNFDQTDTQVLRSFYSGVAPLTHPRLFHSFYETTLLCALYGREIATQIGTMNTYEAEAVGFIHDMGRLIAPHRYGRNDLIADAMLKNIGVRTEVAQQIGPLMRILGMSQRPIRTIEDLTLGQMVNHVSDNLGKFTPEGELWKPEDLLNVNSSRVYRETLWPSETKALEKLNDGGEEFCNGLVAAEARFLQEEFGLNLDVARMRVWDAFRERFNQDWLEDIKARSEPRLF